MPSPSGTNLFPYGASVAVALTDQFGNAALARSTVANIPSAAAGYAIGCILQATDTGGIYTNTGTAASCTFTLLEDAGGTFTLPVTATDASTTTGTSVLFTQNAVTTGSGFTQALNGLTTGTGHLISHTTAVIADGGSLLRLSSTSIDTGGATNGTLLDLKSTAQLAGVLARVDGILTTGSALTIVSTGVMTTTGNLLTLTANSATTAAGIARINANALTDGIGLVIASSSAVLSSTGRLFSVSHSGAATVSGVIAEVSSAGADETVIFKVTASAALAAGVALQVSGAAITTGSGISAGDLNALTDGFGINVASSSAVLTSTGRLLRVSHSGAATVSGVLAEVASAAADETVIFQVSGSGLLAAGKAVNVSVVAMTTGKGLSIEDADALTTGAIAAFKSNSADATARTLVSIHNDHASAVGALVLGLTQDAPTSTNFFPVLKINGFTIWAGNGNTPNAALTGTAGDWLIGGDSGKGYYCTGTTNWTAFA